MTGGSGQGQRRRVAIVQRYLPAYRAPFYECLRSELDRRNVSLSLVVSADPRHPTGRGDEATIPWAIDVRGREIGILGHRTLWQPLIEEIRSADLVVVEQASRLLLNNVLLLRQWSRGKPLAFWGHGRSFHGDAALYGAGERLKRWMSRRVHWWFAYNELSERAVRDLGFPARRITVVHNSIDTRTLRRSMDAVTPESVSETRLAFGLGSGPIAIFVGNLSSEKQLDFLVDASDHLHHLDPSFSLLIVGEGRQRGRVEQLAEHRGHVRYVGSRFGADLARCFVLADVLLVPGWAGLVVVDSFAAGVPLVASASFPHPPEISYIASEDNGILVEDGRSPVRYAERVHRFLGDPDERARLVKGCAEAADRYSIEAMAGRFADGIVAALRPR